MPVKKRKDGECEDSQPTAEKAQQGAEASAGQQPETPKQEAKAPEKAPDKAEKKKAPSHEEELKAEKDKYLRLMAEYDNFRKRSARERDSIYADVRVDTVTRFLPVYDNLERALAVETADEAYRKGVEMTFTQLCEVMKKLGVETIEAKGKTFDPQLHNAVMHVQDESLGENVVVEEFQKGFKMGDKIIRCSMVKVAN